MKKYFKTKQIQFSVAATMLCVLFFASCDDARIFEQNQAIPESGWAQNNVVKFDVKNKLIYKVPHTGWNQIAFKKESKLMNGIPEFSEFYFVHSYHTELKDMQDELVQAEYGRPFTAGVERQNIVGVQFHPEKSHKFGMKLLSNFANNY